MKVLFGTVLIDAFHAALEDREIAFNRVGAGAPPTVFLATMSNR